MASYQDRVQRDIQLTSPDGNQFAPKWIGGPRKYEKSLGIFKIPKLAGQIVQDMDVGAITYSLELLFDGPDNDTKADKFFKACAESGRWRIVHPVKGDLVLQLMSVSEAIEPVRSGNVTVLDTEWIEPLDIGTDITAPKLAALIDAELAAANAGAADDFANADQSVFATIVAGIGTALDVVQGTIETLTEGIADVQATMDGIKDNINGILSVVPGDLIALAGQMQALIQTPALLLGDINAKLDMYEDMIDQLDFSLTPTDNSSGSRNTALIRELCITAAVGAMALTSTIGSPKSRRDAVLIAERNVNTLSSTVDSLDAMQATFEGAEFGYRYYSQTQSYGALLQLSATATKYLILSTYSLKIERRFRLRRPRAPIEIVITEYGSLGVDDVNLDLFISSNGLSGDDIIMLPYDREVVVYR